MHPGKHICSTFVQRQVLESQLQSVRAVSTWLKSSNSSSKQLTLRDIPGPSPSLPFIGTSWQYFKRGRYHLKSYHETSMDKFCRYGPIVREDFNWKTSVVHLFDPKHTEEVLRRQGKYPIRPANEFVTYYRKQHPEKYDVVGIAHSLGEEWYNHRQLVAPAFLKENALDRLVDGLDQIGDDFINVLRAKCDKLSGRLDNFQTLTELMALEAVYLMCLDTRLGCLDTFHQTEECRDMMTGVRLLFEAFHELHYGLPLWKIFETKSYKKLDLAESLIYKVASKRIDEALKVRETEPKSHVDNNNLSILESLLRTKGLSETTIKVTVMDLIPGGVHTVASALPFLIDNLARNPEVQEKIYQELKTIMPDGKMTKQRFKSLQYLKHCLTESFRLTPTIPFLARALPEDITLSGYRIPAGTLFMCHFSVPCQQAEIFEEPEKFKPERWLNRSNRPNPFAMLPFGFGTRMCIGRRLSEMEMYTILAKMVYNFKFEPCGEKLGSNQIFIVMPSEELSVLLHERKSS